MKTLTQILQEQYAHGIKLNKIEPADLIKQLKKLSGNQDIISWTSSHESDIVHIDKFKMAKDGKVTVGDDKMDSSNPEHVVKTYRSTDDAKDTLETWSNRPVFVGEGKLGTWYFVIVNDTADVKRIIQKINPRDVLLLNYQGNSYYKLNGLSYATADSADQDKETAIAAKKNRDNRLAWNKEIPLTDYKFEDEKVIPAAILNKIRQLVGLTSKISVFDEPLKARLEAWQRAHHLTVTGEWDNDTQEQFITLLQDKDLGRATANEYIAALVDKTDIKPPSSVKPTTDDVDQVELATKYRIWANSSSALQKKYGKSSKFKLDPKSNDPANTNFDKSYKEGQTAFDARDKTKTYKVWKPALELEDGTTDVTNIK